MKKQVSTVLAAALMISVVPFAPRSVLAQNGSAEITYKYGDTEYTRNMEALDRGLVAVATDGGVFLSWRLLGTETSVSDLYNAPGFDVYKNEEFLAHVADSTNFLDTNGTPDDTYSVAIDEGERCEPVSVLNSNYIEIPLDVPETETIYYPEKMGNSETMGPYNFTPADTSCGDLDGDGQYELIVKWVSNEKDVGEPGDPAYSGTVRFAAYELTGEKMWENDIELGRNVYSSAHTVQFLVYDFDGDGKAEMTCQTSLGSKDAKGGYVTHAAAEGTEIAAFTDEQNESADYRGYGRITEGEEFLTVFSGETGEAIDTIDLPTARVSAETFGDDFGNRCNRFVADVAYLDGERPYAVYLRGYYHGRNGRQRMSVCGVSFDGEKLSAAYRFDTLEGQPGYAEGNEEYVGNGNHNMTVADVDNDGMDELFTGALCLEADDTSDLSVKWCTFRGHGDALHIGDYDPTHEGMEFFTVHEETTTVDGVTFNYGMSIIDAATGEILFHRDGSKDTGRGLMANTGMGGFYQISGAANAGNYIANGSNDFSEASQPIGTNFRVFWDGDLYDEALDGTNVSSWDGRRMSNIFSADGCTSINGTKANPALQADLFGDWREELVYPTKDGTALRVYTTTELTEYKLPTLMHDPVYRSGVAAEQSAYNQPPHIGFYLSEDIFKPEVERIEVNEPQKTEYRLGETFDRTGLEVTAYYVDGSFELVDGYTVSGFDSGIDGDQFITVTFGGKTTGFTVHVDSGFIIDENGIVTDYDSDEESAILPLSIDGVQVRGFADNALVDSTLTSLTVNIDELEIGENVFPEGIVISCTQASDIYAYAIEHGIDTDIIDTREFTFELTYDEQGYDGLSLMQGWSAKSETVGHITYGVGGRRNGGGDNATGIYSGEIDGNAVLYASVGRWGSRGRNSYMTLNDLPMLSDTSDSVFETDIMFPTNDDRKAKMEISDENGIVDTVSESALGLSADEWYTYRLVWHRGNYYRSVYNSSGELISRAELGASDSDRFASNMEFYVSEGTIGAGQRAEIVFDNTRAYTGSVMTDTAVIVKDAAGEPIPYASVKADGTEYFTDINGKAYITLDAGIYDAVVSAEGYESDTVSINAYRNGNELTVTLEPEFIAVTGVAAENDSIVLTPGMSAYAGFSVVPSNATESGLRYESSDDTVAVIDEKGMITAIAAGECDITAYSVSDESISARCAVKVIEGGYEQVLTSVEVTGPADAYIPNTGTVNKAVFEAVGYDQNGVAMSVEFDWAAERLDTENGGTDGITVTDGVLEITSLADVGTVKVTASCGGISGSAETVLSELYGDAGLIGKLTFEKEFHIHVSTDASEQTVDTEYITYYIGHRDTDGTSTYIDIGGSPEDGRQVLEISSVKYTDTNRYPRLTFQNAPESYMNGLTYVLDAELKFTDSLPMQLRDKNAAILLSLSAESLGAEAGKWYHYTLMYRDGAYTQVLFDENGDIVSVTNPTIYSSSPVAMLSFELGTESPSRIYFSDIDYRSTENGVMSLLEMNVKDENGMPVEGAEVSVGAVSAETGAGGKAYLELPDGIYNVDISKNGAALGSATVRVTGRCTAYIFESVPEPEILSVNGSIINADMTDESYDLYAARYDNGVLSQLKSFAVSSSVLSYDAGFEPDKVFLWNGMTPVDIWTAE